MEVVQASLGPLLHCVLQCSPGISLFSFFFLLHIFFSRTQTHVSILAYVYIMHIHLHVNGNPGNLLTSPLGTWRSLTNIATVIHAISPVFIHPSRPPPCVLFIQTNSEHIATATVLQIHQHVHSPYSSFLQKSRYLCFLPPAMRRTIYW